MSSPRNITFITSGFDELSTSLAYLLIDAQTIVSPSLASLLHATGGPEPTPDAAEVVPEPTPDAAGSTDDASESTKEVSESTDDASESTKEVSESTDDASESTEPADSTTDTAIETPDTAEATQSDPEITEETLDSIRDNFTVSSDIIVTDTVFFVDNLMNINIVPHLKKKGFKTFYWMPLNVAHAEDTLTQYNMTDIITIIKPNQFYNHIAISKNIAAYYICECLLMTNYIDYPGVIKQIGKADALAAITGLKIRADNIPAGIKALIDNWKGLIALEEIITLGKNYKEIKTTEWLAALDNAVDVKPEGKAIVYPDPAALAVFAKTNKIISDYPLYIMNTTKCIKIDHNDTLTTIAIDPTPFITQICIAAPEPSSAV